MNAQTKSILLKFDEVNRYETPTNFNAKVLEYNVIHLVEDLESHFGIKFKVDNQVQDASFYADIIIPSELIINPTLNCLYAIRISNFGNLATVSFGDSFSNAVKDKLPELLQKHNFIFISSDDLDEDYNGNFIKFNEILGGQKPSWRIRYFDYL
jgi:hypothetical protein